MAYVCTSIKLCLQVNPHDYRAWHGLGQTYEFIQMYTYALHYYQKAYMLRPFDARLSRSLGTCYKDLGELKSAIKCFTRALQVNDDPDEGSRVRWLDHFLPTIA